MFAAPVIETETLSPSKLPNIPTIAYLEASKYAIVGMFGSFDGDRVSVSITGAANKAFSLEEINNKSPNQLKVYDFDKLDYTKTSLLLLFGRSDR